MHFSAHINTDRVADAMLSGWMRMCCALQKYDGAVLLLNQPLFHILMPSCSPKDSNQQK